MSVWRRVPRAVLLCERVLCRQSYACVSSQAQSDQSAPNHNGLYAAALAGGMALLLAKQLHAQSDSAPLRIAHAKEVQKGERFSPPVRPDLPEYRMSDVKKHSKSDGKIWTTYQNGVYDITEFCKMHPGGSDKILMAAGDSVDLFWDMYMQHKTEEVMEILEELRIGTLHEDDAKLKMERSAKADDVYANEPVRHPALIANSEKPYNAETSPLLLTDSFFTPNALFFVRNHLPVPKTDESTHKLDVEFSPSVTNRSLKKLNLSVADLKRKYKAVTVNTATQCAGNRRAKMAADKPGIKGLTWNFTAISNASYTGVRLRDLLLDAGVSGEEPNLKHVHLEGADQDTTGQCYGASITFKKAMHPDTIIAYEMNGQPIPIDHGFPLRAVIPGVVGARQVKWLNRIRLSDVESDSHWQQRDYRMFSPATDWDNMDYSLAPSIQEAPVTSAICSPLDGTTIPKDSTHVEMSGYAWSGGGRGIVRVDVSLDGGHSWHATTLQQDPDQTLDGMYSWTLWKCRVPLPQGQSPVTLICKATDRSYNTQPETTQGIWNIRGLLNNSWHKVNILRK